MAIKYIDRYFHFDDGLVSDRPTVIEVGTFSGRNVRKILEMYPEATVVAVEASPDNYRALCKNLKEYSDNKNVVLKNAAITGAKGMAKFYIYKNRPSSNSIYARHEREGSFLSEFKSGNGRITARFILKAIYRRVKGKKKIEVERVERVKAASIRSLMEKYNLGSIDLIIANIEGAEKNIIMELLTDHKVRESVKQLCLSIHERILGRNVVRKLLDEIHEYYDWKVGEGKWACHLFIRRESGNR